MSELELFTIFSYLILRNIISIFFLFVENNRLSMKQKVEEKIARIKGEYSMKHER